MAKIILEIEADPTGLAPAENAIKQIGKLTDDLYKKLQTANAAYKQMAQSIAQNANNAANAQKNLNKSVDDFSGKLKVLNALIATGAFNNAAEDVTRFVNEVNTAVSQIDSLNNSIEEMNSAMDDMISAGNNGSSMFAELSAKIIAAKGSVDAIKKSLENTAQTTKPIEDLKLAIDGMGLVLKNVKTVFTLFGIESKFLEQSISTLSTVSSIFKTTMDLAKVATEGAAAAEGILTIMTEGTTIAMQGLKAAIAATGIGLLVVGIATYNSYINDASSETEDFDDSLSDLGNTIDDTNSSLSSALPFMEDFTKKFTPEYQKDLKLYGEKQADYNLTLRDNAEAAAKAATALKWWTDNARTLIPQLEKMIDLQRLNNEALPGGIKDLERQIKVYQSLEGSEWKVYTLETELNNKRIAWYDTEILHLTSVKNKMAVGSEGRIKLETKILDLQQKKLDIQNDITILDNNYYIFLLDKLDEAVEKLKYKHQIEENALLRNIDLRRAQGATADELAKLEDEYLAKQIANIQAQINLRQKDIDNNKDNAPFVNEQNKKIADAQQLILDLENKRLINSALLARAHRELAEKEVKEAQDRREQRIKAEQDAAKKEEEIAKEIADKKIEEEKRIQQAKKDAIVAITTETFQTIFDISEQNRKADYDAQFTKLSKEREDALANKNLTEAQKKAINDKFDFDEKKLKEKQFRSDKQAKKTEAAMNGFAAIAKLMTTTPPVLLGVPNPMFAIGLATIIATTALQIAKISATPMPQFAKGTRNAPPGFKWVGEQGPELINTPGNHAIITAPESAQIAAIFDRYGLPSLQVPQFKASSVTNILNGSSGGNVSLDYDEMGRSIARHLPEGTKVNISMDKDGVHAYVVKANSRVNYNNNKFRFN